MRCFVRLEISLQEALFVKTNLINYYTTPVQFSPNLNLVTLHTDCLRNTAKYLK
jgi:hypothetical protein